EEPEQVLRAVLQEQPDVPAGGAGEGGAAAGLGDDLPPRPRRVLEGQPRPVVVRAGRDQLREGDLAGGPVVVQLGHGALTPPRRRGRRGGRRTCRRRGTSR